MGGAMQKNRGFTLIELMVTIAVLAIVASIAAPSFSENITRQNLDNSAREILFALNEGRSRAIALRSTVVVCPNKDNAGTQITAKQCVTKTIATKLYPIKNHNLNTYKTNTSWIKGIKKQITEISAICLKNKV